MNEPTQPTGFASGAAGPAVSAGALLRQWREAAGVDQVMLASVLKVTPQKIEALEEDRFDDLPNLAFARSLASTVCRAFGMDPDPVLALMPVGVPEMQGDLGALREPFPSGASRTDGIRDSLAQMRIAAGVPGWLLALVIVLLIGALALWFLPGWHADAAAGAPQSVGSAAEGADQVASAQASALVDDASAAAAVPAAPAVRASVAEPGDAAGTAEAAPQASVSDVASVQSGSSAVEQDVITFTAMDRAWVLVRDGSGKVRLGRVLRAGDQVSAGGELPLSVTVGDKDAVTVMVRGELIDLDKRTRRGNRVVKFTVGPAKTP